MYSSSRVLFAPPPSQASVETYVPVKPKTPVRTPTPAQSPTDQFKQAMRDFLKKIADAQNKSEFSLICCQTFTFIRLQLFRWNLKTGPISIFEHDFKNTIKSKSVLKNITRGLNHIHLILDFSINAYVVPFFPVAHADGQAKNDLDKKTEGYLHQNIRDIKQAQVMYEHLYLKGTIQSWEWQEISKL